MEIVGVDPRDQTWKIDSPRYRVYFFEGTASEEYEIRGVQDIHAVMEWANSDEVGRPYVLYVCVDHDGLGLLRLAGHDPNDVDEGSPAVMGVTDEPASEGWAPAGCARGRVAGPGAANGPEV
ncbi:hypothetical protein [Pseudonocardia sp. KRD291]|uniref:hypothetical protein n=1 Tax=Pseudonocardia sp. KRD291 TaxID=2792007 RepID=UPI001C4A02F0|nr:hypothetical protein [Pseudonocardia sp. KRD291]MBW0102537.1 hypothetical protein [Pseudonocardia sp. KRD291]